MDQLITEHPEVRNIVKQLFYFGRSYEEHSTIL